MKVKKFFALIIAVSVILTACDKGGDDDNQDFSIDSSIEVDEIIQLGGYDWRVLEVKGDRVLVVTEGIIEKRAYHSEYLSSLTWAQSDMRKYLNGSFYNSTFSAAEKEHIIETQVANNDNPWYGTDGGEDTTDKVFLLSLEEVVEYFGDSGMLSNRPEGEPIYLEDEYNVARRAYDEDGERLGWWTRTPGYGNTGTVIMYNNGSINVAGDHAPGPYGDGGVRPALWLSL